MAGYEILMYFRNTFFLNPATWQYMCLYSMYAGSLELCSYAGHALSAFSALRLPMPLVIFDNFSTIRNRTTQIIFYY